MKAQPSDSEPIVRYVHREFREEVMAIGGHYRFTDEVRLPLDGEEVFYLKGYAIFDTTCCGAGGCGYALVQGAVEEWKTETDSEGLPVSRIRPVEDPDRRDAIARLIKARDTVQQVQFA